MEEQLISFETAKLAKEKEFNINTKKFYYINAKWYKDGEIGEGFSDDYWGDNTDLNWNGLDRLPIKPFSECVSAPTQSLLQKWLREVHHIDVFIVANFIGEEKHRYSYYIIINEVDIDADGAEAEIYEEALEAGLQEALKLI